MRLNEILLELRDAPASFEIAYEDDKVCEVISHEFGISLDITRGPSSESDNDSVTIEFSVNGAVHMTGKGNSIKIMSTVVAMLEEALPRFIQKTDNFVEYGAESSELSRVSLYTRGASIIDKILGPAWERFERLSSGSLRIFSWRRKNKQLSEKSVESSWITDITHNRPNKVVTMRLSNGRSFSIQGIARTGFEKWVNSRSKGRYFHDFIRGNYKITRIV